jgi:hypothetical protein
VKYFIDSEFVEDGATIDLLSIAIVGEDGRSLYRCFADAKLGRADDWVVFNVYPKLPVMKTCGDDSQWRWSLGRSQAMGVAVNNRRDVVEDILEFLEDDERPEFWGYFADYDWVAFCQLFGRMIDLPGKFPKFCMDLRQWRMELGEAIWRKAVPAQNPASEHSALADAEWVRDAYMALLPHRFPLFTVGDDGKTSMVIP